jgi:hypothetical protein
MKSFTLFTSFFLFFSLFAPAMREKWQSHCKGAVHKPAWQMSHYVWFAMLRCTGSILQLLA